MCHPIDESTTQSIFGQLSPQLFYQKHGVQHHEEFFRNQRGMQIFSQSWQPVEKELKGVVVVVHGFTGDSSWSIQLTSVGIAKRGFAVHALDLQGHGKSEGMRAHIPDIYPVIDDCIQLSDVVRQKHNHLPKFLFGESLGGAIALLMHFRQPDAWNGLILNGAMCGISEKFKPPWPLEHLLGLAATLVPTWPIVPTKNIGVVSFKEPWKLQLMMNNPMRISLKPRPTTALELLRVVKEIECRLQDVSVPFLILHGEMDVVCDPEGVKALYEKACSKDKSLKMYEGMWHQLVGEPKDNLDIVFGDVCSWLEERAHKANLG